MCISTPTRSRNWTRSCPRRCPRHRLTLDQGPVSRRNLRPRKTHGSGHRRPTQSYTMVRLGRPAVKSCWISRTRSTAASG
jgi:hypothetical protein